MILTAVLQKAKNGILKCEKVHVYFPKHVYERYHRCKEDEPVVLMSREAEANNSDVRVTLN